MSQTQRHQANGQAAVTRLQDRDHPCLNPERSGDDEQQQQSPLQQDETQRRTLFVHSLPASATTESLAGFFSQSYPLKHAVVISNPTTKASKGYGFVTFVDSCDALTAIETFASAEFDGKKIKVELAEPRSRAFPAKSIEDTIVPKHTVPSTLAKADPVGQKDQDQPSSQLIVRNLPWSINDPEKLARLFRSFGKVKRTTIPQKPHGLSAGFGFVVLRGRKNAEKALENMNGRVLGGRTLAVDWAVRKDLWDSLHPFHEDNAEPGKMVPQTQNECDLVKSVQEDSEVCAKSLESNDVSDVDLSSDGNDTDAIATGEDEDMKQGRNVQNYSSTLFVRNVPFTVTDERLHEHFSSFGPLRYARIVVDPASQRSKGTAFVCFLNEADAVECLKAAPQVKSISIPSEKAQVTTLKQTKKKSILEDASTDICGRFTVDGRILHLSRAVDKGEAARLTAAGHTFRGIRDRDKRRLYLLSEGTVPTNSSLHSQLTPSEVAMREESVRQRQNLIRNNPALHLSLTRLSVRNLPRNMTSKDLKALAREAVVGFSRDVKANIRQALSKEEVSRAGDSMREAEKARKAKGKGIVKQSKIVFESTKGGRVSEGDGAGRSRGYGFIEYTSHRWALMGLRWLNGYAVESPSNGLADEPKNDKRKKRLIVEFAIENAQVVGRRQERESSQQAKSKIIKSKTISQQKDKRAPRDFRVNKSPSQPAVNIGDKRKRPPVDFSQTSSVSENGTDRDDPDSVQRLAKKQKIIGRKRMSRRARKLGSMDDEKSTNRRAMCNFEHITYNCQHETYRRISHCHFARNDPVHACFGVKVLKRGWFQAEQDCDDCIRQRERTLQHQHQQQQQQQQQQQKQQQQQQQQQHVESRRRG
ncbi:MAG: hypothetical protein Q9212_001303 [Teloschistes hypoglaucus]